jgi:hypothetical protein
MKKFGCFLLFVMTFSAPQAFASGDLTLFGGLQRTGRLTLQNATSTITSTTPNLITFDPKNFGTFGIRLGIGKKVLGTESTFAYSPNFISSNAHAVILNQNLNLQIPTPIIKPYATVGLGTIITAEKSSGIASIVGIPDIGTRFALNYGGGLKAMFGPVGGRLDVRGYALPSVQGQTANVVEVSLGVVFGF